MAFENQIVVGRVVQLDLVLKSRTAAAFDRDAQGLALGAGANFRQTLERAIRHFRWKLHVTLGFALNCCLIRI